MTQTWFINGRSYNHSQLMELRKKKINPAQDEVKVIFEKVEKEECELNKCDCNCVPCEHTKVEETKIDELTSETSELESLSKETPEQEFERLVKEKAWLKKDLKDRYNELKTLLNK